MWPVHLLLKFGSLWKLIVSWQINYWWLKTGGLLTQQHIEVSLRKIPISPIALLLSFISTQDVLRKNIWITFMICIWMYRQCWLWHHGMFRCWWQHDGMWIQLFPCKENHTDMYCIWVRTTNVVNLFSCLTLFCLVELHCKSLKFQMYTVCLYAYVSSFDCVSTA